MEFRVFRVVFPNGDVGIEADYDDITGNCGFGNLESMANHLRSVIEKNEEECCIHFSPVYDMRLEHGLKPRLCVALNKEERQRFWECYIASRS